MKNLKISAFQIPDSFFGIAAGCWVGSGVLGRRLQLDFGGRSPIWIHAMGSPQLWTQMSSNIFKRHTQSVILHHLQHVSSMFQASIPVMWLDVSRSLVTPCNSHLAAPERSHHHLATVNVPFAAHLRANRMINESMTPTHWETARPHFWMRQLEIQIFMYIMYIMYMWCMWCVPFFSLFFLANQCSRDFWWVCLFLTAEVMMPQLPPCSSMALTPQSLCFHLRRWKCTSCRPPPVRLLMWVVQVRPSPFELLKWLSARLPVLLALVLLHHSNHPQPGEGLDMHQDHHISLVYSPSVLPPAHLCDTTDYQLYTHGHWIV